jgi:hypothetical protein
MHTAEDTGLGLSLHRSLNLIRHAASQPFEAHMFDCRLRAHISGAIQTGCKVTSGHQMSGNNHKTGDGRQWTPLLGLHAAKFEYN